MAWKLYLFFKIDIMKSRIFKALLAIVVPIAIDFIVKKVSEKLNEKKDEKQLPA